MKKSNLTLMVVLFLTAGCRHQPSSKVELDNFGNLHWNDQPLANYLDLRGAIRETRRTQSVDHTVTLRLGSTLTAGYLERIRDILSEEGFYRFQYESDVWKTEAIERSNNPLVFIDMITEDGEIIWIHNYDMITFFLLRDGQLTIPDPMRPPDRGDHRKNDLLILCAPEEPIDLLIWAFRLAHATGYDHIDVIFIHNEDHWPQILRKSPDTERELDSRK